MDEAENYVFLNFHIKILTWLRLWPRGNELENPTWASRIQNFYFLILLLPNSFPLVMDNVLLYREEDADLSIIIQSLIGVVCVVGQHYMAICFLYKRKDIVKLVGRIKDFRRFSDMEGMIETDKTTIFHAKVLLFYSTIGFIIYAVIPLMSIQNCKDTKSKSMDDWGIPCGLVERVRLPFKFNYSPMYEFMYLHQFFMVAMVTWVVIMLTMLQCGVLSHATHHLKKLRKLLLGLGSVNGAEMEKPTLFCILYHIEIIEFCKDLNDSFSSQMVMHISLTSFVISILGFELLVVNFADFIRFVVHLMGWLFLLLLVCYYGQTLIDQSTGVARDAYVTDWYKGSVKCQNNVRMMIMRAQKPITLNALNLGYMSLPTFLSVMGSAYSYFTLLINLKFAK